MRAHLTIVAAVATLLSSLGLYPLFEGTEWAWAGLGAIIAVAAAGLLSRRFRLPVVAGPPVALVALLVYLTARYTPGQALLGVVPTPTSLAGLGELVGEGWAAANHYAAPVPAGPGIELLAATGIGMVAVIVDLLAVRMRRAAPAGLPLLALYSVPAAIREESLSWVAFALGAAGFLALLLADSREQVGAWGRPVSSRRGADAAARPVPPAAAGRLLGVAAVAIAVTVPTVVPGVQPRGPFGLGGGGQGGSQTVTTPDPLVSLKRELTRPGNEVVLTYRTDDPSPDYLRLYALDRFDGDRWTYSPLQSSPRDRIVEGRPLPPPPGLLTARSRAVTTQITVAREVRDMNFLPVPYAPSMVSIEGDWRVHAPSLMIYSLREDAAGRDYAVSSLRVEPSSRQLARATAANPEVARQYLHLPAGLPAQIQQLTEQVTAGADTHYEQARKLQQWFTSEGRFVYDTGAVAPKATSDLVDFLLVSRRGYCEQFAAAMAMMARMLGIPARVAMGYTSGTQGSSGEWVVRSRDAHAWPELYFEGAGWVRFEPTPSGPRGQGSATVPSYTRESTAENRQSHSEEAESPADSPSPVAQSPDTAPNPRQDAGQGNAAAGQDHPDGSEGGLPLGWLTAVPLVALILMAPMAARMLARRRRWARVAPAPVVFGGRSPEDAGGRGGPPPTDAALAAHAAWQELRANAIDHGLTWRSNDSPRATALRLSQALEPGSPAVAALERIARAEERARYAPVPAPADTLREDVRIVREAFGAVVDRRTRWRARLAPPSTMEHLRESTTRVLGLLGRRNAGGPRAFLRRVSGR